MIANPYIYHQSIGIITGNNSLRTAILLASFAVTLLVVAGVTYIIGQDSTKITTVTRYSTITQSSQINSSSSTSVITSVRCMRTGEGWGFYVHVVADGTGKPIAGATVNAISSTFCLASPNSTSTITDTSVRISATTPNNGTISLPTLVENYSISVTDGGMSYSVDQVVVVPVLITNVTISFPSGNITITHNEPLH